MLNFKKYQSQKELTYIEYLQEINGIRFTLREIDVMACVMYNRGTKKIASILSISHRTTNTHLYNIMHKLQTNSRDSVTDFIHKHGKLSAIRNYYFNILADISFIKTLSLIKKLSDNKEYLYACSYNADDTIEPTFVDHLAKYLSLANIHVSSDPTALSKMPHLYVSNFDSSNSLISKDNNIVLILNKDKPLTKNTAVTYLDFTSVDNFYFSVLELIGHIVNKPGIEKILQDFSKKYQTFREISDGVIPDINSTTLDPTPKPRTTLAFRMSIGLFIMLCLSILIIEFIPQITFLKNPEHKNVLAITEWDVPRQNIVFMGREKLLKELAGTLLSKSTNQSNQTTIAVCEGLGGNGKTQLALQYILHTQHKYTMKIWFSGNDMSKFKQRYEDFAVELGYNKATHPNLSAISYVKKWLALHPGWLMVINNVDNYQDIEQFLPDKGGHLILTTRNRDWPNNFKILSIGVMTEAEAVDTLNILVKGNPIEELEQKKELAARLGYLPLALSQAGSYIYQKNISVAEYIQLYNSNELNLLSDIASPNGLDTTPVFVVWDISLHAIFKEMLEQNEPPIAMELIIVCSYLAPEKISRELLLSWVKYAHPNLSSPELALNKHIKLLWKYSMINYEDDKNTISIHRLVQTVLRYQLARSIDNEHGMFPNLSVNWYSSLLSFFIANESDFKIRNSFSQLLETRDQFLSLFKGQYNDKLAMLDLVIAPVYYYQEKFEDYSKLLSKVSLYLLTKPNREYLKAKVLYLESASARKKGDFKLAEENIKAASEIFKKVKVDDNFNAAAIAKLKGQILFNKANLVHFLNVSLPLANRNLNAIKESIILTREGASIFAKTHDLRNKLKSIELRGRLYVLLNENQEAIKEFDEYQDIVKKVQDNRLKMSYYDTYSDAYLGLGNLAKSLEYCNMAKDLAIKLGLKIHLQDINLKIQKISDMMSREL